MHSNPKTYTIFSCKRIIGGVLPAVPIAFKIWSAHCKIVEGYGNCTTRLIRHKIIASLDCSSNQIHLTLLLTFEQKYRTIYVGYEVERKEQDFEKTRTSVIVRRICRLKKGIRGAESSNTLHLN